MYGLSVSSNYKTYGEKFYTDDRFIATAGTIGSLFNGIIRLIMGFLMDIFSYKICLGIILSIEILADIALVTLEKNEVLFVITLCFSYMTVGGYYVILPTVSSRVYGKDYGARLFGFISLGAVLGNFS